MTTEKPPREPRLHERNTYIELLAKQAEFEKLAASVRLAEAARNAVTAEITQLELDVKEWMRRGKKTSAVVTLQKDLVAVIRLSSYDNVTVEKIAETRI